MGNSRYVGRVGALAVALGIGTAIGAPVPVAWADESSSGSSSGSSSESDSSSGGSSDTKRTGPGVARSADRGGEQESTTQRSTRADRTERGSRSTSGSASVRDADDGDSRRISDRDLRRAERIARESTAEPSARSGGLDRLHSKARSEATSPLDSGTTAAAQKDSAPDNGSVPEDAVATVPAGKYTAGEIATEIAPEAATVATEDSVTGVIEVIEDTDAEVVEEVIEETEEAVGAEDPDSDTGSEIVEDDASDSGGSADPDESTDPAEPEAPATEAPEPTDPGESEVPGAPEESEPEDAETELPEPDPEEPADPADPADPEAPTVPAAQVEVSVEPPPPPPLIRSLVIGVLGVFGFNPNSPTPQNPILEGIWGLYRRLEAVIYRDPPTAAGGALPQVEVTRTADGLVEVTGNVGFEDPTGNPLAYTSTDGEYGTVTVHEDGTFTYTVTDPAGFTGTDTFTVTARNTGWHSHGLNGRASTVATVTVDLDAVAPVPAIGEHTGPSERDENGVVTGSFVYTDAAGREPEFEFNQLEHGGSFKVDVVRTSETTWQVDYTHVRDAEFAHSLAYEYREGPSTVTEHIVISLVGGPEVKVDVAIPIEAENIDPEFTGVQGGEWRPNADGETGYHGYIEFTDADGDDVHIVVTDAEHGTVYLMDRSEIGEVTQLRYLYMPDPDSGEVSESIHLTVSDIHGGSRVLEIAVPPAEAVDQELTLEMPNPDSLTPNEDGSVDFTVVVTGVSLPHLIPSGMRYGELRQIGFDAVEEGTWEIGYRYVPTPEARELALVEAPFPTFDYVQIVAIGDDGQLVGDTLQVVIAPADGTPVEDTLIDTVEVSGDATGVAAWGDWIYVTRSVDGRAVLTRINTKDGRTAQVEIDDAEGQQFHVAVDARWSHLYVSDGHRVWMTTAPEGTPTVIIEAEAGALPITDLATVSERGELYVLVGSRVRMVGSDGTLLSEFDLGGLQPSAMAGGPSDLVYIADSEEARVQMYRARGGHGHSGEFDVPAVARDIAVDRVGWAYVLHADPDNPGHDVVSVIGPSNETARDVLGTISITGQGIGVTVDRAGNLYVTHVDDDGAGKVSVFDVTRIAAGSDAAPGPDARAVAV
ncbi:hypothetical protein MCHIJ_19650 [Mycolicibacterium chitae]|uniref:Chitinase, cellulase n=1 Tax=Mycolicibacterium chitae TaxID=1792 RepID=A0A3S4SWI0_MYCCI|nr:Ig-like domain-containing protein [Mycolicibacterium chitae]MCV7108996.1 hypothetical protein [Mycolicibacterium chitae]BBZ02528.1 hypothetical protein MCHIJ_19650 [Mycolicibacterium chitae]VEG45180.1 chitinase, cellulase [Mycolicibacterium chitae]